MFCLSRSFSSPQQGELLIVGAARQGHVAPAADLAAGADQARTSGMRLADQLDLLEPVSGAGQPSASSEQKASHFFRSTSKAACPVSIKLMGGADLVDR